MMLSPLLGLVNLCFYYSRRNVAPGQKQSIMILFHHFTWLQFGIAAIGLTLIWYAAILLLYFRKEAQNLLTKPKPAEAESLQHAWETDEFTDDEEMIGDAAEPEGVTTHSWNSFGFAGRNKENAEDELNGLVPDALEEIKLAVHTAETQGGGKSDFISLFKLVATKYARLKDGPHLEAINEWILENVPYDLTEDELWQLWE